MNFGQMRRIVEHPHLKGETNFAVLMVLAFHANEEARAWPSKPTIAREARVSERTADDVIARLEKANYLTVERGGGSKKTNSYLLHVERGTLVEMPHKGGKPRESCGVSDAEIESEGTEQTPRELRGLEDKPRERYGVNGAEPRERYGVNGAPYKEKYLNNGNEVSGGGVRGRMREATQLPPPQANATPPPRAAPLPTSPIIFTLCDVCGLMLDTLRGRDRDELNELLPWLQEQSLQEQNGTQEGMDDEAVATAVRARFAMPPEGAWDRRTPPRLSQIKPDWKRMGIIAATNARVKPDKETQNGKYPNSTRTRGMGAVSEFADGVRSTRRAHRAELDT